jgi:hypothetical protein
MEHLPPAPKYEKTRSYERDTTLWNLKTAGPMARGSESPSRLTLPLCRQSLSLVLSNFNQL